MRDLVQSCAIGYRKARVAVALTSILLVSADRPAAAQATGSAPPPVGTRVRLETRDGSHIIGVVRAADADSIRLSLGRAGDPVERLSVLPLSAVRSYALSDGRDRRRGARNGALVGGGLGLALVAYAAYEDSRAGDIIIPGTLLAVPVAVGLTAVGTLAGTVFAPERWGAPVALELGLGAGDAVYLGLRVRF